MGQEQNKRRAAAASLEHVREGMLLGVGTGSTVNHFIDGLAAQNQRPASIVSSSEATSERLRGIGLEVTDLNSAGTLDLYVDGADEADPHLRLIKGGGGALTREKIIAAAARQFICIVDDSKLVRVLGAFPLPVEVVPMARSFIARELIKLGGQPIWREGLITDNHNQIIDVHNLQITDPLALEREINQIPGVVCVGLFAQRRADVLLVGSSEGVRRVEAV